MLVSGLRIEHCLGDNSSLSSFHYVAMSIALNSATQVAWFFALSLAALLSTDQSHAAVVNGRLSMLE